MKRGITYPMDDESVDESKDESDGIVAVQRLRLTFSKFGAARYIGHLDLARTLERALNRSHIPVAYSQGFNRRPRLTMAAPLTLGYTSEAELADIWLTELADPVEVRRRLMDRMAPGIEVTQMVDVPLAGPSLQQSLMAAEYQATFLDRIDQQQLLECVDALLAADSLPRERKRAKDSRPKPYDLRPLVTKLTVLLNQSDGPHLAMRLVQTSTQTGRPDEVLASLGFDPLDAHIHRTGLFLESLGRD